MELQLASAGSYPRIGNEPNEQRLRQAYAAFERGEIARPALRQAEDEAATHAIEEQVAAGLDLVTDGLVRWYDPISHIAQALMGIRPGALRPFFRTGMEYRQPRVRGPLLRTRPIVATEVAFARSRSSRPVKAVLTGPLTLAAASVIETPAYPNLAILTRSYAEILATEVAALVAGGVAHIQIDEPAWLSRPEATPVVAEALALIAAAKADAELTLALLLGDATTVLDAIGPLPIDVLAVDVTRSPRTSEALSAAALPQRLALGVVDVRTVALDDIASRARTVAAVLDRAPAGPHYLTTAGGLEVLPLATARHKLGLLTDVRRAVTGSATANGASS
jgi:5-methyltetrahydropteroyltriglutamate--homocysteine methyltransferase